MTIIDENNNTVFEETGPTVGEDGVEGNIGTDATIEFDKFLDLPKENILNILESS